MSTQRWTINPASTTFMLALTASLTAGTTAQLGASVEASSRRDQDDMRVRSRGFLADNAAATFASLEID